MDLFDILGPITVGPSSSHTAGAARIGLVCRKILQAPVQRAEITFFGSFADTYKGHGTDRAIIGGLMGMQTDDENIRDSLSLAAQAGLEYVIKTADNPRLHPNTACIKATGDGKSASVCGCSVGGGLIYLTGINDYEVKISCKYDTTVIFHRDTPGFLADISYHLSMGDYNIGNMNLLRAKKDGAVVTVIETDTPISDETLALLQQVGGVSKVMQIPKIS